MKKYNTIAEMESDKIKQRWTENRAIIAAMTDDELIKTVDMIHEEQGLRTKDIEAENKKRLDNMSESDFIRGRLRWK